MKTLKELRENIERTKHLILQKDIDKIINFIDDSQTIFAENKYFLVDLSINNLISLHIFNDGKVAVSYKGLSIDTVSESVALYDFIDSLKKEIKDIFFGDIQNRELKLINDLLDLTGYEFTICSYFKDRVIKVSDNYFDFQYSIECNIFAMHTKLSTFIIYDDDTEDSYNLFKRLDTYKETHKYIKELLENYIKGL